MMRSVVAFATLVGVAMGQDFGDYENVEDAFGEHEVCYVCGSETKRVGDLFASVDIPPGFIDVEETTCGIIEQLALRGFIPGFGCFAAKTLPAFQFPCKCEEGEPISLDSFLGLMQRSEATEVTEPPPETSNTSSSTTSQPTSALPSAFPTLVKSSIPTGHPTGNPSVSTTIPTLILSTTPSQSPTLNPTYQESLTPSVSLTDAPSGVPSIIPSKAISAIPSDAPTSNPSVSTRNPTLLPFATPSQTPSVVPTSVASEIPSTRTTSVPTQATSSIPSGAPTLNPSVSTRNPTLSPFAAPSQTPTPSVVPTSGASDIPSTRTTSAPTQVRSSIQSGASTSNPLLSARKPTLAPFTAPSRSPSGISASDMAVLAALTPTRGPASEAPTIGPVGTPTRFPTASPFEEQPTKGPTITSPVSSLMGSPTSLPLQQSSNLASQKSPSLQPQQPMTTVVWSPLSSPFEFGGFGNVWPTRAPELPSAENPRDEVAVPTIPTPTVGGVWSPLASPFHGNNENKVVWPTRAPMPSLGSSGEELVSEPVPKPVNFPILPEPITGGFLEPFTSSPASASDENESTQPTPMPSLSLTSGEEGEKDAALDTMQPATVVPSWPISEHPSISPVATDNPDQMPTIAPRPTQPTFNSILSFFADLLQRPGAREPPLMRPTLETPAELPTSAEVSELPGDSNTEPVTPDISPTDDIWSGVIPQLSSEWGAPPTPPVPTPNEVVGDSEIVTLANDIVAMISGTAHMPSTVNPSPGTSASDSQPDDAMNGDMLPCDELDYLLHSNCEGSASVYCERMRRFCADPSIANEDANAFDEPEVACSFMGVDVLACDDDESERNSPRSLLCFLVDGACWIFGSP